MTIRQPSIETMLYLTEQFSLWLPLATGIMFILAALTSWYIPHSDPCPTYLVIYVAVGVIAWGVFARPGNI
jgi:hypothetical protein